jgi:MFS family permease
VLVQRQVDLQAGWGDGLQAAQDYIFSTRRLSFMSSSSAKPSFYYGWVNVVMGAIIMLATLPGRTHGLGLITEPLLKDLQLDRVTYAEINLWATLMGALFCLPIGGLIDRLGVRLVAAVVAALLGVVVWQMSVFAGSIAWFFILVMLTRGLGQSALSVTSITAVGKWFPRRNGAAMGVYSVLMTLFFMAAFYVVGNVAVPQRGWRAAWAEIAMALLFVVTPLVLLLVRNSPESCGVAPDSGEAKAESGRRRNYTLAEALRTPAFWVFAGGISMFGLVSSGLGLFNQSVFAERGFGRETFVNFMTTSAFIGLVGQFAAGWAMSRVSVCRLLAVALLVYGIALGCLPYVTTLAHLWIFAVGAGMAGGAFTVLFFAIWSQAYGREHLGRIQSAAQILTVLTSALGPLAFAKCHELKHSYSPILFTLAVIVLVLGVVAWWTSLPASTPMEEMPQAAAAKAA